MSKTTTNKVHAEACRVAWLFYFYSQRGTPQGTPTLLTVEERGKDGEYALLRSYVAPSGQWEEEDLELDLAAIPNVSHWVDNTVRSNCKDKYSLTEVLRLQEDGATFYPVFDTGEVAA